MAARGGVRDLLFTATYIGLSQERFQLQNPARGVCAAFDAAFAKLLWPLVNPLSDNFK